MTITVKSNVKQEAQKKYKNAGALARAAGISTTTAAYLYRPVLDESSPSILTLVKVAAALGVPYTDLIEVVNGEAA